VKEVRVEPSRREACVVLVYETVAPVERATDVESDPAHARLVDRLVSASSARAPPCAGLRYHSCAHVLTIRTVCAWHCAGSRMKIRRILENAMALRCRSCALATSRGICSLHPSHAKTAQILTVRTGTLVSRARVLHIDPALLNHCAGSAIKIRRILDNATVL
jgi:hypothetical protein